MGNIMTKPFYSFKNLGDYGRLGNQLFQYAYVRALALRNDCDVRIPYLDHKHWHGQQCLLEKNFNVVIKPLTWRESAEITNRYNEPDPFVFHEPALNLRPYTDVCGFFQSIDYFRDFEQQIKKELWPKNILDKDGQKHCPVKMAQQYIQDLKDTHGCSQIISLHMRRGDNTDGSIPHQYKVLKNVYGDGKLDENSIYFQYFQKCKKEFDKNVKYLIFTGGSRKGDNNKTDLEWCKENFSGSEFLYSEGNVIEDFCRIMACDGNILSHISSFGWWAAYLGMELDKNKKIVCPNEYHPDKPGYTHRQGFYPESWIKI